jgi:AraC-like DNA-binding protein
MSKFTAYLHTGDDPATLIQHDHDCHELVLVERGSSEFTIENRLYIAGGHSLVVIGNLERHYIRIDQTPYHRQIMLIPNDFLIREIHLPLLASFFLYRPQRFSHVISLNDDLFHAIQRHFSGIIEECRNNRPLKERQLGLMLEMLLLELYRGNPQCYSWENSQEMTTVFLVQRYVAQHFKEHLTLSDIADKYRVSKYHLSRRFQIITGYSFQKYLTVCRLNEAKRLLRMSDHSITLITELSGYGNVNNFIRAFKAHEGMTPLQFRKYRMRDTLQGHSQTQT